MPKLKDKRRANISVATEFTEQKINTTLEIDRLEERRLRCQDVLERAEWRSRREKLSENERQELEDQMSNMNERVQKLDEELQTLRGENRRNMMLSVALLAVSAFFYYIFFYTEENS